MSKINLTIDLIQEVRLLFHSLANVSEVINEGKITASQRGVMESLIKSSKTVPDIAREKGVSRQHILKQVTALETKDLVSQEENPAHKKSFLISLSSLGMTTIQEILSKEKKALEKVLKNYSASELGDTKELLSKFRNDISKLVKE